MESLYIEAHKRLLTTSHPFNYTISHQKILQIDETYPRSGKTIDTGSMVRGWGDLNELA